MRWREYLPSVSSHPAYLAAERAGSGSRPKELFEDVLEELEEAYDRAKVGQGAPAGWGWQGGMGRPKWGALNLTQRLGKHAMGHRCSTFFAPRQADQALKEGGGALWVDWYAPCPPARLPLLCSRTR